MEECKNCGREMELLEGCPSCFVNKITDKAFFEAALTDEIATLKARVEELEGAIKEHRLAKIAVWSDMDTEKATDPFDKDLYAVLDGGK
jgi:hypothetical protein